MKNPTLMPDGYTLLLGSGSEISIARLFNSAVKYNGETDLAAVGLIGTTPMVFVAGQKLQKAGISNEGGSQQALSNFIKTETQRVRSVVNQAISTGAAI
jgi:hypothetical protein